MSAIFLSLAQAVVFWIVLVGGPVVFGAALIRLRRRFDHSAEQDVKAAESPRARVFLLALFVLAFGLGIYFGFARIASLPNWLLYPGLLVYLLGMAVSYWAYSTLGTFYSGTLRAQPNHKVVQTGPYRRVRHPGYSGVLLSGLGLGLALQSWVAVLVLLVGFGVGVAFRIPTEEALLVSTLGDEYRQYRTRTKRIIPFVW